MTKPHPVDEKIYIFSAWCKACGICLGLCPAKVFEMGTDGKPIVAHPELCTLCGMCENHCPDFAIGWTHPKTVTEGTTEDEEKEVVETGTTADKENK